MAGTITAGTLSDGSVSTSTTNCIQGSAKAWVNFNGTLTSPITPRASYNVTNVTKNATGDFTINFTNPLTDGNFSTATSYSRLFDGSGASAEGDRGSAVILQTSGACRVLYYVQSTKTGADPAMFSASCFR